MDSGIEHDGTTDCETRALCNSALHALLDLNHIVQSACPQALGGGRSDNPMAHDLVTLQASLGLCSESLGRISPCVGCETVDCTGKFATLQVPVEAAEMLKAVANRLSELADALLDGIGPAQDALDAQLRSQRHRAGMI